MENRRLSYVNHNCGSVGGEGGGGGGWWMRGKMGAEGAAGDIEVFSHALKETFFIFNAGDTM